MPKNWCYDLASRWNCLRLLWRRFSPFSISFWLLFVSSVEWWTHVSSMVMNRRKKSTLLLWNITKYSIETSSRRCFCTTLSKYDIHLVHRFLMYKFSVNMRCTVLFEMPTMSASSRTFSRRSSNTILRIFFTISVVVTSLGWSLGCSSWQLVRIRLNFASQYFIVINEGIDFPGEWEIVTVSFPPILESFYHSVRLWEE